MESTNPNERANRRRLPKSCVRYLDTTKYHRTVKRRLSRFCVVNKVSFNEALLLQPRPRVVREYVCSLKHVKHAESSLKLSLGKPVERQFITVQTEPSHTKCEKTITQMKDGLVRLRNERNHFESGYNTFKELFELQTNCADPLAIAKKFAGEQLEAAARQHSLEETRLRREINEERDVFNRSYTALKKQVSDLEAKLRVSKNSESQALAKLEVVSDVCRSAVTARDKFREELEALIPKRRADEVKLQEAIRLEAQTRVELMAAQRTYDRFREGLEALSSKHEALQLEAEDLRKQVRFRTEQVSLMQKQTTPANAVSISSVDWRKVMGKRFNLIPDDGKVYTKCKNSFIELANQHILYVDALIRDGFLGTLFFKNLLTLIDTPK